MGKIRRRLVGFISATQRYGALSHNKWEHTPLEDMTGCADCPGDKEYCVYVADAHGGAVVGKTDRYVSTYCKKSGSFKRNYVTEGAR